MRVLYLLTVAAMAAFAQTSETPLQSLPYSPSFDVTDMDRTVNPCQDFYQYTCGGWLKKNPIPPDQSSWSVYAKLTQDNERFLWGILLDAAKPNPARSNVEREIGDFFAACMDETAVKKAGAAPLTEELGAIGSLKSVADFPDFLAREHLSQNFGMLFGFSSSQDYADSSREIAFAGAGGLGLPDRDYYTKTDAKSEEIRKKYVEHVARMLELLGDTNAHAPREAQAIMRIETALAKASLTRVEQRDPYKLFHKMDRAKLQALTPAFEWPRYLKATGLGELNEFNVTEPAFYKEVQTLLTATPMDDWKAYLRWHLVNSRAAFLAKPFADANFDFYSKYLRGTPEQRPRWKRCVQYVDSDLGEALGQVFVERTFSAGYEGAHADDDQGNRKGHGGRDQAVALDERSHQAAGARQAARRGEQDRLSGQMARLQLHPSSIAAISRGTSIAPRCLKAAASWPRSASRWTAANGA